MLRSTAIVMGGVCLNSFFFSTNNIGREYRGVAIAQKNYTNLFCNTAKFYGNDAYNYETHRQEIEDLAKMYYELTQQNLKKARDIHINSGSLVQMMTHDKVYMDMAYDAESEAKKIWKFVQDRDVIHKSRIDDNHIMCIQNFKDERAYVELPYYFNTGYQLVRFLTYGADSLNSYRREKNIPQPVYEKFIQTIGPKLMQRMIPPETPPKHSYFENEQHIKYQNVKVHLVQSDIDTFFETYKPINELDKKNYYKFRQFMAKQSELQVGILYEKEFKMPKGPWM